MTREKSTQHVGPPTKDGRGTRRISHMRNHVGKEKIIRKQKQFPILTSSSSLSVTLFSQTFYHQPSNQNPKTSHSPFSDLGRGRSRAHLRLPPFCYTRIRPLLRKLTIFYSHQTEESLTRSRLPPLCYRKLDPFYEKVTLVLLPTRKRIIYQISIITSLLPTTNKRKFIPPPITFTHCQFPRAKDKEV